MTKEETIAYLESLISAEEFRKNILHSADIWRSDPELFDFIFSRMNVCTKDLIKCVQNNASTSKLKTVLNNHLRNFNRQSFDTEDAEFITECFEVLASIVNVKYGSRLFRWLYGLPLWLLYGTVKFFRRRKDPVIYQYTCGYCNNNFEIHLVSVGNNEAPKWVIGKCGKCEDYNLTETPPNAIRTSYKNFLPVEFLSKEEFSEEKAIVRLEQIRTWRK